MCSWGGLNSIFRVFPSSKTGRILVYFESLIIAIWRTILSLPELEKSEVSIESDEEPQLKANTSIGQILMPVVVTVGIFAWVWSGIDFESLQEAMAGISWWKVTGIVGAFCVVMYICDVFSFGASFKWLVDPRTTWIDIFYMRTATIFAAVIFPPAGEVFAPYYFYKKWGQPVLLTLGAAFFVVLLDSSTAAISLASAFIFFDTSMLSPLWLVFLVGHSGMLLAFIVMFSRLGQKYLPAFMQKSIFFGPMRQADFLIVFKIFCVRALNFLAACATIFYLIKIMKIDLSVAQALLFIPLFWLSTFLPISAGGYGGPQGASILFLVELWSLCSAEQALGFSLLWSTFFLLGRSISSGVFVLPAWGMFQKLR